MYRLLYASLVVKPKRLQYNILCDVVSLCVQAAMTSLYDVVSSCVTRCYLCHVTVEMSHLRQVKLAASDDVDGDWLTVADTPAHCTLRPGDRWDSAKTLITIG